MKTILLITTLLFTVGCKDRMVLMTLDEYKILEAKVDSLQKRIDNVRTYDPNTGKFIKNNCKRRFRKATADDLKEL